MTFVKICGVTDAESAQIAAAHKADFIGFVAVSSSPRIIEPQESASLSRSLPPSCKSVYLFSNPTNNDLERYLNLSRPDFIQLHGDETPARVHDIQARYHIPIIKAFAIQTPNDLDKIRDYIPLCDWLLFDAAVGGSGRSFDWKLIEGKNFERPWMLAGGLNTDNVETAIAQLHPDAVDVSSGIESAPAQKDRGKMIDFLFRVKNTSGLGSST